MITEVGYEKVNICGSLDEVVAELLKYKKQHKKVYTIFNGVRLFSDRVNIDSAYEAILGKNREEYYKELKRFEEKAKRKEEERKAIIAKSIERWKNEGRKVIDDEYLDDWDSYVPKSLEGLYNGAELSYSLEIIAALNNGLSLKEVNHMFYEQNHSGMSEGIVLSLVGSLCKRGEEFTNYYTDNL